MEYQIWWIWISIAALLIIAEIFTAGFFLLWFGVGAAFAGVMAMFGFGSVVQWTSFIIISFVLFLISRKFADRITSKQPPGIGADRFVGVTGTVIEEINNREGYGRIRLGGREEWRAESEAGNAIAVGTRVKVNRVEGTRLIVTELKEGE